MHDLTEPITSAVEALHEKAAAEARRSGRSVLSCVMTKLRPYVRAALNEIDPGHAGGDGRQRPYCVSAKFWDVTGGEQHGELEAEADEVTARSLAAALDEVAGWIRDFCDKEEPPEEASTAAIQGRIANLRSMVTRGGGEAVFRVRFALDGRSYLVTAPVSRGEAAEPDD